jgi:2-methylcitrate dehydratase PrpD
MEDASSVLARYVAKTRFEMLPPRVVELTKLFVLDTLGTMIAGAGAPQSKEVVDLVKEWGGKPESTVAVYGGAVPASQVILANSMMAHALDLDDLHDDATVHASCVQVPVGFAMVEATGKNGKELITSIAIGIDLSCRIGLAIGPAIGFTRSAITDLFGAAASTAKMLDLDEDGIRNALAICLSQAAGSAQVVIDGALVKRMQPAMSGRSGVLSAYLARAGIKGPRWAFQGQYGFFELYKRGEIFPEKLTDRLGEFFEIENVSVKLFCGGRYIHGPAEAAIDIVTRENLKATDIAKMTVWLPKTPFAYVGKPFEPGESPQTNAQFSAAYGAASGVVYHDLFIDQVQEDAILNPEVLDLAQKRTVVLIDESVTELGATMPVSLQIETQDGRKFYKKLQYLKGHPENFIGKDEFINKFRKAVKWCPKEIPQENVERIIELVDRLEELEDPSVLMRLAQPARLD